MVEMKKKRSLWVWVWVWVWAAWMSAHNHAHAHAHAHAQARSREFDSMLNSVRAGGYDLFCNAIVTSDLQMQILSDANNFTFFAPTDASLFALDMTLTASSYTDTLRFHVVPGRFSLAQLRLLPDGYMLPTLLPHRTLQLSHSISAIAVGGVDVSFPDLFYGRNVAVHGLAGVLSLRSVSITPSPAPTYPNSAISQPPEDAMAMAPAPQVLEGITKCLNPADVVLEDESAMHCYAP